MVKFLYKLDRSRRVIVMFIKPKKIVEYGDFFGGCIKERGPGGLSDN